MSTVHVIAQNEAGAETYYSPRAARALGSGVGWTSDPSKALAFARHEDAQIYLEYHLGHIQYVATVVPKEIA